MKFIIKTVIATTAFVAMVAPVLSHAGMKVSDQEHSAVAVSYHQVELRTAAGKSKVESQIRQAARQVCGSPSVRESGSVKSASANKSCYDHAVEKGLSSITKSPVTGD